MITKRELFNINPVYQPYISDIFSTLVKSKRNIINLKFCNFLLDEQTLFLEDSVSSVFWQNCGIKVGYLEFSSCEIKADILVKILKCCANLTEFCYHSRFYQFDKELKMLINDNVIFKKVTFLSLTHSYSDGDYQYAFLPEVFPHVRKLNMSVNSDFSNVALNYVLKLFSNLQYLELGYVFSSFDEESSDPSFVRRSLMKILPAIKQ